MKKLNITAHYFTLYGGYYVRSAIKLLQMSTPWCVCRTFKASTGAFE